jgi:NADP-dependent 3-hydroxy acid dehydrogenase YdfG
MAGLRGKVVLVTGASSGIGQGTAIHMASLGCKLSLIARNMEALKTVSEKCKEAGSPDVYIASHDLADEKECIDAVNETVKHFGGNVRNGTTEKRGLK